MGWPSRAHGDAGRHIGPRISVLGDNEISVWGDVMYAATWLRAGIREYVGWRTLGSGQSLTHLHLNVVFVAKWVKLSAGLGRRHWAS